MSAGSHARKTLVLLAFLAGCNLFGGASSRVDTLAPEAQDRFDLARRLVAERKESEAVEILRSLLIEYPDSVRLHREYQDVRIRMGEEDAVRAEYQALSRSREDAVSMLMAARLEEDAPRRRSQIEAAIERDRSLPWGYFARAFEFVRESKFGEARDEFHRAARLGNPFPEAQLAAAESSLRLGDYAAAIDDLEVYLESRPNDVAARFDMAASLASVGRVAESQVEFARVLEAEPRDKDARIGLGNALLRQGKVDEALAEYEEVAREDPTNPDPYYNIGIAYEGYKGDSASAVGAYQKFLDLGGKESLRVSRWIQRLTGQKP
ncbi:MAG: tetratricopeptide repeat protein [Planctomycetes bacterium]|nr:tetratricopeptide repeat protein [Planctomycetota bacterium]